MLEANLTLTESAIRRVAFLQRTSDAHALRVYITGGGCSGFQYGFKLDEQQDDDFYKELTLTQEEKPLTVGVVVDSLSMQYLEGATIDFIEGLQGSYFSVHNPNAETTCGCGSSFSIK